MHLVFSCLYLWNNFFANTLAYFRSRDSSSIRCHPFKVFLLYSVQVKEWHICRGGRSSFWQERADMYCTYFSGEIGLGYFFTILMPLKPRAVFLLSSEGIDTDIMKLFIILFQISMFPVNGNLFDYLPEQPCDSLVIGMFSFSSFLGKYLNRGICLLFLCIEI